MSVEELMDYEFRNLCRARNEKALQNKYNEMTNEELMSYVRKKWETVLNGSE